MAACTEADGPAAGFRDPFGENSGPVLALCQEAGNRLSGEPAAFIARVAAELAERTLRVGVVGRVSSGKSTLVNCLLGSPVAGTGAGECTRTVTVYRHGDRPEAVMHLRDGRTVALTAPGTLPTNAESVAYVEVRLPAPALRSVTLIDSPGVSSGGADASKQTHDLVSGAGGVAPGLAAIVFVLTQNMRQDEYELLRAVDHSNTLVPSAVHTIGVLTKADLAGGGGVDAGEAANGLAASIADQHRAMFASVVPVMGLLAEAGNCGRLAEHDAGLLSTLAEEWRGPDRELALLAPSVFCARPSRVDGEDRRRLLAMLSLGGIRALLGRIDEGTTGAAALNAACRKASGYADVEAALNHRFRDRADVLKASRALSTLLRATHGDIGRQMSTEDRRWLRTALERVRYDPRTHRIRELEVLHRVLAGQVVLPTDLEGDLVHMVEHRTGTLGARVWQRFEARATSAGQRAIARVLIRSYLIAMEVRFR